MKIKTLIPLLFAVLSVATFANEPTTAKSPFNYNGTPIQTQGTFAKFDYQADNDSTYPFVLYTPQGVQKNDKRPLLVYLHGAISRDNLPKDPIASSQKSAILQLADKGGYFVLFPYGNKSATWFDKVGTAMVLDEIGKVLENPNIDRQKVFLSGFSDGASGTLYLASVAGDRFAGFIALNGSLSVSAHLGKPSVFVQNINKKPLFVVNTTDDMLYPVSMMTPTIDFLKDNGQIVHYKTPNGNHEMGYLPSMLDELQEFVAKNSDTVAQEISLEVSELSRASFDWLKVEKLALEQQPKPFQQPYSLTMYNDKASFGIQFDPNHQGNGLKVSGFKNEKESQNTAKALGVQVGDVIIKMGETTLDSPYAPYTYLASKKAGEPVSITVMRDGQELVLNGKFADGYAYQVFEKQDKSGKIIAKFNGKTIKIQTSKIAQFAIDFTQLPIRHRQNFPIVINGKSQKVKAIGVKSFVVKE